jgi:hypothetical protein
MLCPNRPPLVAAALRQALACQEELALRSAALLPRLRAQHERAAARLVAALERSPGLAADLSFPPAEAEGSA